jgi:hypothetical protein
VSIQALAVARFQSIGRVCRLIGLVDLRHCVRDDFEDPRSEAPQMRS